MKISISFGKQKLHATLRNTSTAKAIYKALPIKGAVQVWGKEAYFEIPVTHSLEDDATETVPSGSLAYWPQGNCFCIFWGQTPISAVNIFGMIDANVELLDSIQSQEVINVEKL